MIATQYQIEGIDSILFSEHNTLIQYLTINDEENNKRLKNLFAFFIDSDGEIAEVSIEVSLSNLSDFIDIYKKAYVVFRDEDNQLLFEVSDGLLVYTSQEIDVKRCDVREVLYKSGLRNIR
ncbi:hypothetical protein [Virgibacillus halodenitrificans]|uniref:hypothetical protein n=1 Tax=Virgibacillus halodenitrificans TaxID=1482 RepID=UPI000EF4ABF1|nr:hypothetical protein [Virgibacillus halodenitrificans]